MSEALRCNLVGTHGRGGTGGVHRLVCAASFSSHFDSIQCLGRDRDDAWQAANERAASCEPRRVRLCHGRGC